MSYPTGSIPLTGAIGTTAISDTFATHIDYLGYGGARAVALIEDRDAITTERRVFGMIVTVSNESDITLNKPYILANAANGGADNNVANNANWIAFVAGSAALTTVTKGELDTLITNSGIVAGQFYEITGVDVDLYGGTTIILQATSTYQLSQDGVGFFYNPLYNQSVDGYGIWSNSSTVTATTTDASLFDAAEDITADNGATAKLVTTVAENSYAFEIVIKSGDWSAAASFTGDTSGATATIDSITVQSYAIGATVIWGHNKWINTTGNVGTATDDLTLSSADWTLVAFDKVNYDYVCNSISYDYENDVITRRSDNISGDTVICTYSSRLYLASNVSALGSPISIFQWGNAFRSPVGVGLNTIDNFYCNNINFKGAYFTSNKFSGLSYFTNNNYSTGCIVTENEINSSGYVSTIIMSFNSVFAQNQVTSVSNITEIYLSSNSGVAANKCANSGEINNLNLNATSNVSFNIVNKSSINAFYLNFGSSARYNEMYAQGSISGNKIKGKDIGSISNNFIIAGGIAGNNIFGSTINNNNIQQCDGIRDCNLNPSDDLGLGETGAEINYNSIVGGFRIGNMTLAKETSISYNTISEYSFLINGSFVAGGSFSFNKVMLNYTKDLTSLNPISTPIEKTIFS